MSIHRYFLPDFIEIQRNSFCELLDKGLIEEFSKRNPINNVKKDIELYFYPEYYKLTVPEFNPRQAILNSKSYTSKLYMPVQLTDKISKIIKLKWVYIGNLPLMTKRGHFILNGAARVIVNQIIRSPGIYYQEKLYENYNQKWSQKAEGSYKRYYADLICLRGTWLRLEIDKDKNIWAQTKKGPKIPVFWFLIAMGLSEKIIFKSILEPNRLVQNLENSKLKIVKGNLTKNIKKSELETKALLKLPKESDLKDMNQQIETPKELEKRRLVKQTYAYLKNPPEAWKEIYSLITAKNAKQEKNLSTLGRKWLFNKFMNPRTYDLGKQGRLAFNKKLGLNIAYNQLTLTPQDLLYATDYLIKVEKGFKNIDDIDHLKNRRVRTSGELIQMQVGIGLVRLEKVIREKMNKSSSQFSLSTAKSGLNLGFKTFTQSKNKISSISENVSAEQNQTTGENSLKKTSRVFINNRVTKNTSLERNSRSSTGFGTLFFEKLTISNLINTKAFNSALREFFGTSPLSQFMDQINPLAEITHKRRLSSMGPGGVTRDTATLAIRGIHPTHYGRICPVETPEGKNTGLVNSMTTYARVNTQGILESPFYKVYKGQVQKTAGMFFLSAEDEEKIKLAAADLFVSSIGFLPLSYIPVRIAEDFTKIPRHEVQYIGISPIQMISIATSLIPFLEHDDANRALMGSNMQRQAVPLLRPERPIVGTGLEGRAVSDSGHAIQSKLSGLVTYVSGDKIIVTTVLTS
jgi:DNA-directed RNA polymerase subunit beta